MNGSSMNPEQLVHHCLDQMGPMEISDKTRQELLEQVEIDGTASWSTEKEYKASSKRVADLLALIAGTREYQFA